MSPDNRTTPPKLDFASLGGPVYVGRDRGERVRRELGIDNLDNGDGAVEVLIPDDTYSVNSSFFLGMFGESIVRFGSKEGFLDHYHFSAPQEIESEIHSFIDRALVEKGYLKLK